MKDRTGFTIIELMIVIGVIAILAAMLVPALHRSKLSAWEVRCGSNLRQVAVALELYATNHGDFYPVELYEHNPHPGLVEVLKERVPDITKALYCPQDDYMEQFAQNTTDYSPKGAAAVDSVADTPANRAAGNISYIYWSFLRNKPCGSGYWRNLEFFPRTLNTRTGLEPVPETRTGQASYFQRCPPSRVWLLSDYFRQGAPFPHGRAHATGVNVLFADSHVEMVVGSPKINYR